MPWTDDAEAAVQKVPFFVRKKVRARIESEAAASGKTTVSLTDVQATQKRYLNGGMAPEIKGYQLDGCFGPRGCPNRAFIAESMVEDIEKVLKQAQLLPFLQQSVSGDLKFHHEFRVTLADCPNACSQPQIKDIGIIGAATPAVGKEQCSACEACEDVCKENAIANSAAGEPEIKTDLCLQCGQCITVCPTGTLIELCKGYRVQLAGKLGRHPQLARQLPGIYTVSEVLQIISDCLTLYKKKSQNGQRFAEIFDEGDYQDFCQRYPDARCVDKTLV